MPLLKKQSAKAKAFISRNSNIPYLCYIEVLTPRWTSCIIVWKGQNLLVLAKLPLALAQQLFALVELWSGDTTEPVTRAADSTAQKWVEKGKEQLC